MSILSFITTSSSTRLREKRLNEELLRLRTLCGLLEDDREVEALFLELAELRLQLTALQQQVRALREGKN